MANNNVLLQKLSVPVLGLLILAGHMSRGCDEEEKKSPMEKVDLQTQVRMSMVQIKAALNGRNQRRLKKMGVNLPPGIKSVGPTEILIGTNGKDPYETLENNPDAYRRFMATISDYGNFKNAAMDVLQPIDVACSDVQGNCEETRVKNTSFFLSLCAIGYYQILPFHHGKHIDGWEDAEWGEGRMKLIWEFVKSKELQDQVNLEILRKLMNSHDGDPKQMASAYYSGSGIGSVFTLSYWKSFLPSAFGFGSKHKYSNIVKKCYKAKAYKSSVETDGDLRIFQECIALKETGYAKKKK